MNNFPEPIKALALYLGAFLLIFGTRLIVLNDYGSSTPYFSDWEMGKFLHRFAAGDLGLIDWLTPENQHQMMFAKLSNVVLFAANSYQWDTLNVLILNSFLWTFTALFLIYIARSNRQEINSTSLTVVIILVWLIPVSIICSTWAGVTHFYFMMFFLLIGYWGVSHGPDSKYWKIGLVAMASCAFTIGAGIFAVLPLLLIFFYKLKYLTGYIEDIRRTLIPLLIILLIVVGTTAFWPLAEFDTNHYVSRNLGSFFTTFFKTLGWPFIEYYGLGLLLFSPCVIILVLVLRRSISLTPLTVFVLALNAYMVMQAAGIALARNAAIGIHPAPRYYEFLTLSIVANFIALLIIFYSKKSTTSFFNTVLFGVWGLLLYSTIPGQIQNYENIATEELKRKQSRLVMSREYLLTGNMGALTGYSYFRAAYPRSLPQLAVWLDQYSANKSLPVELQIAPPLELNNSDTFAYGATILPSQNKLRVKYLGEPSIGSYNLERGAQNAQGVFKSKVLTSNFPYLMIPTLGFLGLKDLSLELVEIGTGNVTPVNIKFKPGTAEVWQHNYVATPDGEFIIRAKDNSKLLWFGFAAPREVGMVSFAVRLTLQFRHWIWNIGLLILILYCIEPVTRILSGGGSSKQH
ncbi:MAG: hypothetical protein ACI82S_002429 [Patiriisocius sp.]|jgi:hypothetical protein